PIVGFREHLLDFPERNVALELDGEALRVAAHRADANAEAVDRDGLRFASENLVGLRVRLPLLAALPVAEVLGDPRQQPSGYRHAEVFRRKALVAQDARDFAIDLEDRRGRIVEQALRGERELAHLLQELAPVL